MLLSFALLAAYPAGQEGPREPEQFLTKYLGFSHDQILQVFLSSALLLASYLGPVGVKTDSELAKPRKKVTIAAPEGQHEVAVPSGYSTARTGTMLDFDYIQGGWTTRQRRLKARGAGSNEWEEFPGNLSIPLYLGGMATVDELTSRVLPVGICPALCSCEKGSPQGLAHAGGFPNRMAFVMTLM